MEDGCMTAEVDQAGLRIEIPRAELDRLGWQPGQWVTVRLAAGEVTVLPLSPAEEIERRAWQYLGKHVGDALAIDLPFWTGEHWEIVVYLSYRDLRLGQLVFNEAGELDTEASTTPAEMRRAADAP
jgi:hypothetical protein